MTEPTAVRAADGALLALPGVVPPASQCVITKWHRPTPLRFVWHHILPETCGGTATPDNLVEVCDSCHLAIHALMYVLALHHSELAWERRGTHAQQALALRGYELALAAGTAGRIPNEGSVFFR